MDFISIKNTQSVSIPIAELSPNRAQISGLPANPRIIRDGNFAKLKRSIAERPEFLALREILVFRHGGKFVIIGGNMRYRACKELGFTEVPCKIIPESTTTEQLRAYCLIDNSGYGEWDWDALAREWDQALLDACAIEMPEIETPPEDEVEAVNEDNADPTPPEAPVTKPGDLYRLGNHALICGDSTDAGVLGALMGNDLADMWVTDPPYNVDYEGKTQARMKIQNDHLSDEEFLDFLRKAFTAAADRLKPGGAFYIWHADIKSLFFRQAVADVGLPLRQNLVWVKNAFTLGHQDYQWMHEPCLYVWRDGARHYFTSSRSQTTVIHEDKPARSELHPTMKPVKLISRLISNSSRRGDIVLDTFGGSGTTLIAAEQLGRRCRLCEIDPRYCDVIVRRWEDLTGEQAKLMGNMADGSYQQEKIN